MLAEFECNFRKMANVKRVLLLLLSYLKTETSKHIWNLYKLSRDISVISVVTVISVISVVSS